MGLLDRLLGREETQIAAELTQQELSQIQEQIITEILEKLEKTESNSFYLFNQAFTALANNFAGFQNCSSDKTVFDAYKSNLFEKSKLSLAKVKAQTSMKEKELLRQQDRLRVAIKEKLVAMQVRLDYFEKIAPVKGARLRELIEPIFVKLGKQVNLPQEIINAAIPTKGWF